MTDARADDVAGGILELYDRLDELVAQLQAAGLTVDVVLDVHVRTRGGAVVRFASYQEPDAAPSSLLAAGTAARARRRADAAIADLTRG